MVPPDGYPIIGTVEGLENFVQAVMHRGVSLGPIVGQLLVEIITGQAPSIDLHAYRMSRFGDAVAEALGDVKETFYAAS
jgi:glycine/D-amino acid oxidase-like deaminating enzyme